MSHRGISDRFFGWCLGFFVACVLLYAGVQLIEAIIGWLVALAATVCIVMVLVALVRWHRERW